MTQRAMFPPNGSLPTADDREGAGFTAMVLGLMSVFFMVSLVGILLAIPTSLGAVGCGAVGVRRAKRGEASNGRIALIGLILGSAVTFTLVGGMVWLDHSLSQAYP
ncbi:hypothetical protein ACFY41_30565 [Streptomyces syringium]|uniref:hypothetical protein n=1 Tax=Streptomyces syringium TaxID=76729 RepID=UPI00367F5DCE